MNITTHHDAYGWTAIDSDTYDGAPDAGATSALGHGHSELEAIEELLNRFDEGPAWQQDAARAFRIARYNHALNELMAKYPRRETAVDAEAHQFFLYLQEAWAEVERRGIKGPIDTRDSRAIRIYRQCGLTATEAGALRAREILSRS